MTEYQQVNKIIEYIGAAFIVGVLGWTTVHTLQHSEPFEVSLRSINKTRDYLHSQFDYAYHYTITALEDGLIIYHVTINNANCQLDTGLPVFGEDTDNTDSLNIQLNYARAWSFSSLTDRKYKQCKPEKMTVQTNLGEYVVHF